jgi:hypothetical protein
LLLVFFCFVSPPFFYFYAECHRSR